MTCGYANGVDGINMPQATQRGSSRLLLRKSSRSSACPNERRPIFTSARGASPPSIGDVLDDLCHLGEALATANARYEGNRRDFLLRACRILLCVRVIHEDLCLVERASV